MPVRRSRLGSRPPVAEETGWLQKVELFLQRATLDAQRGGSSPIHPKYKASGYDRHVSITIQDGANQNQCETARDSSYEKSTQNFTDMKTVNHLAFTHFF
jgi:hypothetical protein